MYQKSRHGSMNFAQSQEFSSSPQVASPWSCPDTKKTFAHTRLTIAQVLSPAPSLPQLSLKPRLSMKKLAAMDDVCNAAKRETAARSTTSLAEKSPISAAGDLPASAWKSTEEALDLLAAHTKPRRLRLSACFSCTGVNKPETPRSVEQPKVFELIPWKDWPQKEVKASSPTCYLNLPQLPFGRHQSYNDIKDLRRLIVSRKEKAWRRVNVIRAQDEE